MHLGNVFAARRSAQRRVEEVHPGADSKQDLVNWTDVAARTDAAKAGGGVSAP